nr:retrovirus-related Pol polyprotein from transposon TNT 1-94 [Tanacetum cinerariifolium]
MTPASLKSKANKIVDNAWIKHSKDQFCAPTTQDMEILIQTCLMPFALKTQNDSLIFVHELKQEMHADLKYIESFEKEIDKLESDKAELSNMYDMILQECKNDTVWNEQASNVFRKEREQYIKIQDLKAQLQDKNIAISELKKFIEKGKGKSVETKFDKPSVVRQPNAQWIPKPSVLEGLTKSVTAQNLPQTARQAVSNTNVLRPGMYRIYNTTTQTRAPQSPQTVRNTNPHVSTSTGVIHKTNVSRPQHKSNQLKDKVLPKNSQVKPKKTQVEEHPRIASISNKTKSVTACNDSLNSKTSNVIVVCATYGKCLVDSNHFARVTKMLNDVNARTKKPNVVPISTRKPKGHVNKSVATPHKKTVASKSNNQKPQSYFRMLYEKTSLNHNLFSVGQFCDADLKVAFRKSTCFIRDLQGNDLLTDNHGSDLYTIFLQESTSSTPLRLMAKASSTKAWLWHRRLSHLNFDYINLLSKKDIVIDLPKLKYVKDQLCSSCELSKAKRSPFESKAVPSLKGRLNLLHMDLCGPKRVASINGKKYILVIVDDYSRYTWTLFLHSKDETPEVLKEFLTMIQRNLQALVITVRTDRGTKDGENLDKMKEKEDMCILVGYSTQSKGYHVYNKRTRMIVESIYICFDEIKEVSETSVVNDTSGLVPQRQKASDYDNSDPVPQQQDVSSSTDAHVPSQQELDLLFGPLYDEFFNAETEYVALSASCAQVMWMRKQLQDYGFNYNKIPLYCDSQSAIAISCNLVQHSRTKHIHTQYHFIKKQVKNGIIELYFVRTKYHLADMFTKALHEDMFRKVFLKRKRILSTRISTILGLELFLQDIQSIELKEKDSVRINVDHAGCIDTRKSTSGGIQFEGEKLVSWMSNKQDCIAISSAEAEYVALSASCAQSAIAISCKPVQHSRTKHTHTQYHFIKEQVENGITELYFVRTEYQLADMFTKALPEDMFKYLVKRIGIRCLTPAEQEVLAKESA